MNERKKIILLIGIMAISCLIVVGIAIVMLYHTSLEQQKARLIEIARSQVRLIKAVARFDAAQSPNYPGGSRNATISQILDAHRHYNGFGKTGEFTIAKQEANHIVFLLRHTHDDLTYPRSIPFDTNLAEPMRFALSGQSGIMIGQDYRGVPVLAAYEPVKELHLGIVAKIDMAELREPFMRAGVIAIVITISVVLIGTALFLKISETIVRELENRAVCLSESEEKFRTIIENTPDAFFMHDMNGRFIEVNRQACEVLGYSREELMKLSVHEVVHADITEIQGVWKKVLGEGSYHIETIHRRKDGTTFPVEATLASMEFQGKPLIFAFVRDISQRRQAENAIRLNELRLQTLVHLSQMSGVTLRKIANYVLEQALKLTESSLGFIHIVSEDNTVTPYVWSQEAMTGCGIEDSPACFDLQGSGEWEEWLWHHKPLIINDYNSHHPAKKGLPPGHLPISRFMAVPIFEEGRVVMLGAVANKQNDYNESDVNQLTVLLDGMRRHFRKEEISAELRGAKEAAEAANAAKSEFLARMSHEIRTPMNAIMNMCYLVMQTETTSRQQDYLSKIQISAQMLMSIINDILDFSKIEAGKMELAYSEFDLEEVMNRLSDLLRAKAQEKGIELLFSISEKVPRHCVGDSLRLCQILSNLTGNAIKFTDKGEVVVTAEVAYRSTERIRLRFSVRDSGIGIPADKIPMLFESFTQVDSSALRKFGGTGLGLAICKRLTQMMGGEINVNSEPGKGSIFTFTVELGVMSVKKEAISPPNFRGMRVLIADDNLSAGNILKEQLLQSFDFEVIRAGSGKEALAELDKTESGKPFDLIFLDWQLPDMNGIGIAAHIRKGTASVRHIPIIMITGYDSEDIRKESERIGINAFLIKPITYSELKNTVIDVIGKKHIRTSLPIKPRVSTVEESDNLRDAKILLVDDNEINRQVITELLKNIGLTVSIAQNGREAVEMVGQSSRFDLILMDVQMPEMDGYEATRRIREWEESVKCDVEGVKWKVLSVKKKDITPNTPIIAMTAYAMSGDREKCLDAGMNDYLSKPVEPDRFFATLKKYIGIGNSEPTEIKPPAAEPKGSGFPGIDIDAGLAYVSGNKEVYLDILRMFCTNYANSVILIRGFLEKREYEDAHKLAHSMKSASGYIGALRLRAAAVKLEAALRTENYSVAMLLEEFENALNQVIASASEFLKDALKKR